MSALVFGADRNALDVARRPRHFECPTCHVKVRVPSQHQDCSSVAHNCPGQGGLTVPMAELRDERHDLKRGEYEHRLAEREDYVGGAHGLLYADGRPIMASHLMRPDGSNDCRIYAPVAVLDLRKD